MSPPRGSPGGLLLSALRGVVSLPVQSLFRYLDHRKRRADACMEVLVGINAANVKAGDRLWDVRREKRGNTMLSHLVAWPVDVVRVEERMSTTTTTPRPYTVWVVRWNGNKEREYHADQISRLRRSVPRGAST